jgi:hypothetical protein
VPDAKDSNRILKELVNNVNDSVDFLLKFIEQLDRDICLVTTQCFANINAETGNYDINWSNSKPINLNLLKCFINYDLGVYYFQLDNYEKSFDFLKKVKEFKLLQLNLAHISENLNEYTNQLDDYLTVCSSFPIENNDNLKIITITKSINNPIKKIIQIEKCTDYKELYEYLLEDNKLNQLSLSFRLKIENDFINKYLKPNCRNKSGPKDTPVDMDTDHSDKIRSPTETKIESNTSMAIIFDQICSCNLVRLVAEGNQTYNHNYCIEKLTFLSQVNWNNFF